MSGTVHNAVRVLEGEAHVLFAFDIGLAIELDEAATLLDMARGKAGGVVRESISTVQRTPEYFEFRPAPVRVERATGPCAIGGRPISPRVECTLYDFGAVSLSYRVPIPTGVLEDLVPLADELYENAALLADARRQIDSLAREIAPAVRRPGISPLVEDYVVYHLRHVDAGMCVADALLAERQTLARVLRAERGALSAQEVERAASSYLSYAPGDAVVIDWNAAIVIQEPAEDILTVLEFANVELLEMRFMDDRLDEMLDRAYAATLSGPEGGVAAPRGSRRDMQRLASLQMDAALLFEAVNNALKLLGDQYLARVYHLAAARFHLADWDANIQRKLTTLEGIYRKVADEQAARRMETLEWIVIILFVISILIPFVTGVWK